MSDNIFQQIIDGKIPANKIYEDELCLAFHDVNPQAPVHVLLIPKQPIAKLSEANTTDASLLGHLLVTAKDIAKQLNLSDGFRIVINNGEIANQTVFHLHLHILGGRKFSWPPG